MVVSNHQVSEYVVGNCINSVAQGGYNAFSTSARDFNLRVNSDYKSAGFNLRRDQWDVEGLIAKSKSGYANDTNSIVLTQNAPGLKVALDAGGYPNFTFPAKYDPNLASSYTRAEVQYRPTETDNTEDQLKLDVKYRLKTPFFTKIWGGVKAASRHRSSTTAAATCSRPAPTCSVQRTISTSGRPMSPMH